MERGLKSACDSTSLLTVDAFAGSGDPAREVESCSRRRFKDLVLNSVVLPIGDDDMVGKCRVRVCHR